MAKFTWEGTTRAGEKRKGILEADTREVAEERLRGDGVINPKVRKEGGFGDMQITIGSGVSSKDLQVFTRQLATMIDAGLPLVQCLDILAAQSENKVFRKVLTSVKNAVEQGSTFSDALRRHPRVFDELYVNLVAAGEVGGILDTILNRLATYIEKAVKLKGQLKSAMYYPAGIMVVAIGVITIMLTKLRSVPAPAPIRAPMKSTASLSSVADWFSVPCVSSAAVRSARPDLSLGSSAPPARTIIRMLTIGCS